MLAILLRNNHFSTLYKACGDGCLYSLNTDIGFYEETVFIWERLAEVDGNTVYVDCDFLDIEQRRQKSLEVQDANLAMQLQAEEDALQRQAAHEARQREAIAVQQQQLTRTTSPQGKRAASNITEQAVDQRHGTSRSGKSMDVSANAPSSTSMSRNPNKNTATTGARPHQQSASSPHASTQHRAERNRGGTVSQNVSNTSHSNPGVVRPSPGAARPDSSSSNVSNKGISKRLPKKKDCTVM